MWCLCTRLLNINNLYVPGKSSACRKRMTDPTQNRWAVGGCAAYPLSAFQKCQAKAERFIDCTLHLEQPLLTKMLWAYCVCLLQLMGVHMVHVSGFSQGTAALELCPGVLAKLLLLWR